MSGFLEHQEANLGILKESESILQKPFSPFELAKKVRGILDGVETMAKASE